MNWYVFKIERVVIAKLPLAAKAKRVHTKPNAQSIGDSVNIVAKILTTTYRSENT